MSFGFPRPERLSVAGSFGNSGGSKPSKSSRYHGAESEHRYTIPTNILNICLISLLGLDKLSNRSFGNGGGSDESLRVKPEAFAFFVCFGRITWSRTQRRTSTNSPSVAAGRLKPAENEKTNTWLSKPDRPQFPLETEPECLLRVMKWRNLHHARTVIRASPASARLNSTFSKTELSVE